jgi:hypothetical protein
MSFPPLLDDFSFATVPSTLYLELVAPEFADAVSLQPRTLLRIINPHPMRCFRRRRATLQPTTRASTTYHVSKAAGAYCRSADWAATYQPLQHSRSHGALVSTAQS